MLSVAPWNNPKKTDKWAVCVEKSRVATAGDIYSGLNVSSLSEGIEQIIKHICILYLSVIPAHGSLHSYATIKSKLEVTCLTLSLLKKPEHQVLSQQFTTIFCFLFSFLTLFVLTAAFLL